MLFRDTGTGVDFEFRELLVRTDVTAERTIEAGVPIGMQSEQILRRNEIH